MHNLTTKGASTSSPMSYNVGNFVSATYRGRTLIYLTLLVYIVANVSKIGVLLINVTRIIKKGTASHPSTRRLTVLWPLCLCFCLTLAFVLVLYVALLFFMPRILCGCRSVVSQTIH